jgi:hypothetical protein
MVDPAMNELMQRAAVEYTRIRIIVERLVEEDARPVHDYEGPSAVISGFACRLAALTPAGRAVIELPFEAARAVYERASVARDEPHRRRADTGSIRLVTSLALDVDSPMGSEQSFAVQMSINHTAPRPWPPRMSALLRLVRDRFGARGDGFADAFDVAMTWIEPEPLGLFWDAGEPVQLPHVVTAFACDEPVYVRVGQPSALRGPPSTLYRLRDKVLTWIDNATVVPPLTGEPGALPLTAELGQLGVTRWRLPCGGGVIARRATPDWSNPCQIVVRCDDDRGIYVQRG